MGNITILGAGSWGTTFAQIVADSGYSATIWSKNEDTSKEINKYHTNQKYCNNIVLSDRISATSDLELALKSAKILFYALPATHLREHLLETKHLLNTDNIFVSLMKGIENITNLRMSEVFAQVIKIKPENFAVISGANLAKEILLKKPTNSVIASSSIKTSETIAQHCANNYFYPSTTSDVIGVEIGGTIKNIIAIAVGIANGLNLGDNTKSTIITCGLQEATRLATALGGKTATLYGFSGLGDIIATCSSELSRNSRVGKFLGEGKKLSEIQATIGETAEGIQSTRIIANLAKNMNISMPITSYVNELISGQSVIKDFQKFLLPQLDIDKN